jgi:ABC-2 type transport system permease protein
MLRSVLLKTLRDARRALAWWSLGLIALAAMMLAVYPTVRDNPDLNRLVQDYPEALKAFIAFGGNVEYATGAGYLGSELFSFMIPLLLLVAAVGAGARAIAGEEEGGTLDLLLANPLSRRRLVMEKLAALVAEIALLGSLLWLSLLAGGALVGIGVSAAHLAAASVSAGAARRSASPRRERWRRTSPTRWLRSSMRSIRCVARRPSTTTRPPIRCAPASSSRTSHSSSP